ncbi:MULTISPECIES: hypothetical protein [Bacillaceae]|uniref:hypothetical protein n=1 Tax=Bacillaceae TaxID=186817 RepID=UPI001C56F86D|nr:hypothetical protein [Rossellomorea sp. YZS02]MBW3114124.1 hypothetical protein [Bacillus sp. MCCB 382]MDX8345761.1 hypothetical protein [Rossellomorea sp. YZS02]
MANWVPFVFLSLFSIFALCMIVVKNRRISAKIILFWLFISGLAYVFEYIIFVLFNSYTYHPHILSNNYNDSVLGSISSQAFSVPVAITYIVLYRSTISRIAIIIGVFFVIETWFIYTNLYEHHWWESYYTSFFLIISVILAKTWWKFLEYRSNHYIQFITLFFALSTVTLSLAWILSSLLKLYMIPMNHFSDPVRDLIAGNAIYIWFTTYFYCLVIFFRPGDWKSIFWSVLFLFMIESFMVQEGRLLLESYWMIFILPLFHLTMMSLGSHYYKQYFDTYIELQRKGLSFK